jgi:two-component system, OmpR family, sensor kinase
MPIRRRLVLYAVGVATIGVTIFALVLTTLAARGVATDQDAALGRLAAATASSIQGLTPDALAGRQPLLPIDLATATASGVEVLTTDGQILYSSVAVGGVAPRIPAAVLVEAEQTGTSLATIRATPTVELRVGARPWSGPAGSGVVVAVQSTAFTSQQVAGLTAFLIVAGLVTIVFVGLVSWLVIGRALRPLRALAATSETIGRTGDIGTRLPAARTHDEVGLLTANFNAMLDRLAAAQAGLGDALAAQRRFVADASHELRTPLTTIRSNAEFLVQHPNADPPDRAEAVGDIVAESERMSGLIDDLLLLARADARTTTDRRPVDLAAIAGDVVRRADQAGHGERPVTLAAPGPVVVEGEAGALTRLCWILVDNALRHGGGTVAVDARAGPDGASLTVRDAGPGIPPDARDRVFERFYRADPARTGSGTGLGLAIARSIVESHGGTIQVGARPEGGGASLEVRLPLLMGPPAGA